MTVSTHVNQSLKNMAGDDFALEKEDEDSKNILDP